MIQLQVINYILYKKDVEILTNYNSNFFPSYENIYDFIKTHYIKYKVIPDKSTVANKFKDTNYSYFDVDESREYLITELEDEYIMKKVASIVNGEGEQLTINPRQVMANIQRELGNISMPKKTYGVNILDESETENRYNKFLERFNCVDEDVYTFSTGLEKLDEALDRIRREEELIVLYARTNNGKSFIAEKIAASVCEAGHKVGFFSPEMSKDEIGYRYDTLLSNLSNRGMRGNNKDFNADMYRSFMKKLGKSGKYFSVTSPMSFDKQVTVSKIREWITNEQLELIVLDGISYLYDERSDNKARETDRLTNISEDLMSLSMELKLPIIVVVQANRTGARDNEGEVSTDAPELDTIRNSDGISHNASRAISVRQKDNVLTLKLTKNRYGQVGNKLTYNWSIDIGEFTYLPNPQSKLASDDQTSVEIRQDFCNDDGVYDSEDEF